MKHSKTPGKEKTSWQDIKGEFLRCSAPKKSENDKFVFNIWPLNPETPRHGRAKERKRKYAKEHKRAQKSASVQTTRFETSCSQVCQARKRHININFLVRLALGRPRVCPRDKPRFSPLFTQWTPGLSKGQTRFVRGTNPGSEGGRKSLCVKSLCVFCKLAWQLPIKKILPCSETRYESNFVWLTKLLSQMRLSEGIPSKTCANPPARDQNINRANRYENEMV